MGAGIAPALRARLSPRLPSWRGVLIGLVAAAALLAGWTLLRSSPLLAVERVQVTGVRGPDAAAIEQALRSEASHMTTLDANAAALEEAVAPFHLVRSLEVQTSLPHGMRITVLEQLPVAVLQADGERTAVAADGVVLGPALASASLPQLHGSVIPLAGHRVDDRGLLGELAVIGAAPAPLARLIARVYTGPEGLTVIMRNGLLAYFGDATRPHAKWTALALVLADPSSTGASYVDVRLPERPAAGGTRAPSGSAASEIEVGASDPTAAALAARLAEAVSGAPAANPSSASEAQPGGTQTAGAPTEAAASSSPTAPGASAGATEPQSGATPASGLEAGSPSQTQPGGATAAGGSSADSGAAGGAAAAVEGPSQSAVAGATGGASAGG